MTTSVPPVGTPTTNYDLNRNRVIRIAAELFAQNGYHGTGVADLSKAVGLGKGALYHYIGSKEAVLYEISYYQVTTMNQAADKLRDQESNAVRRLQQLARELMRNIAENRAAWTVFFREYHALTGDWRDRVVAARERYEGHWRDTLEQGVRDQQLRPLPPLIVKGLLGMFNYAYLWFDPHGGKSPEEVADDFLGTVLTGMLREQL